MEQPMSKMRKLGSSSAEEMQEENNVDRISNLPECLIHHIFSFLDIKHAVQISRLSRRWRYFWMSLSILNFEFRRGTRTLNARTNAFLDFVDRVLLLRGHSSIQKFSLVFDENNDIANRLKTWMLGAVKSKVQEVCININCSRSMMGYPQCLFTCKSLTKLEWNNASHLLIMLPKSVILPSLKTLHLTSHVFNNEPLTNQIFSSCPVLESLVIRNCDFLRINICISSKKLKHLTLENCSTSEDVQVKTVKLRAPNLVSFHCCDYIMTKVYSLENLSSLVEAVIFIQRDVKYELADKKDMHARSVMKFLIGLRNVKQLTLSPEFFEPLSQALAGGSHLTPFSNLHVLKIETSFSRHHMRGITYLLHVSPRLETFVLVQEYSSADDECCEWNFLSQWVLHHLKFVKILDSVCNKNELQLLKFLLKNAEVLENLTITISEEERTKISDFCEGLLGFPRASPKATISVSSLYGYWDL